MRGVNKMEKEFDTVVLRDEDGNEIEFELIMKFDIEEQEYVIVAPVEEGDGEAIALKIEKDENNEDIFITIDDEDEFEMVSEAYETLMSENEHLN